MIQCLKILSHEQKLQEVNLFTLSQRRMRGDVVEVFKMFKGHSDVNVEDYFTTDRSTRTGKNNNSKIRGKIFSPHDGIHFFNRFVNI